MTGAYGRGARASLAARRLIGRSPPIQKLRWEIQLVAPTDATVLIRGERGTGKELVADAIQEESRRQGRPSVKVNCAALPGELLASELFGHERGAFTGALWRKVGLLAAADGGTLFLDEVGDLSPEAQAMLLRFLDQGEVRSLGSTETFRVDVRLIAATNKDLEAAICKKEFRPDLYDRLSEVVLEVPPLRERREDIPLLIEHVLAYYAQRYGVTAQGVTPQAARLLQAYPWPGNVRELEKTLRRGVIFADGAWIQPEHLGLPAGWEDRNHGGTRRELRNDARGLMLRRREALKIAAEHGSVRRADLITRFGISRSTAQRDLVALIRAGFLKRTGGGRGSSCSPARRTRGSSRQNHLSRAWS
ncbi:MAG: sigma 54-interacting transcriptional regulator [Candidatus Rokubacteria bacterium]|nr:sigma 54-interacting transcriptional regulator [Candidatus Rokubacteria bacterium]